MTSGHHGNYTTLTDATQPDHILCYPALLNRVESVSAYIITSHSAA